MKSKSKNLVVFIVSLAFALTMMTAAAFAADNIEKQDSTDPFNYENGQIDAVKEAADKEMPSKWDLRDKGVVTPVKFQNPWGTCWGFAAISAAETSILSDSGKTYEETGLDLSERHLAWFAMTHISDPENTQCGEGHWSTNKETKKIPWMCFNDGAEGFFATTLFASGIGPQYEKDYPYQNKGKIITWRKDDGSTIDADSQPGDEYEPYCYAKFSNDYPGKCSWAVNESDKFKQKYELKESCMLPTPAGRDKDGYYKYNELGTLSIKDKLLEGDAVQIGFLADQSKPDEKGEAKYLNNKTWAQYTYETKTCNHSVCIVGYDDNYSKDNFNSHHRPPGDGAWIVKNSWGAETNEFPHKGKGTWGVLDENGKHTGYFYLSYYDQSLTRPETLSFYTGEKATEEDFYYIDEYDFMPVYEVGNIKTEDEVRMANVFETEGKETLRAISCQTATPDSHVKYSVYNLTDDIYGEKELVASQEADYKYGGYHRTDLDKPVQLDEQQKYAIEVEITTPSGMHEMLVAKAYGEGSLDETGHNPTGDSGYTIGVINKGESFVYKKGEYTDFTEEVKKLKDSDKEKYGVEEYYSYDNFAIKGYADPINKYYTPGVINLTVGNEIVGDINRNWSKEDNIWCYSGNGYKYYCESGKLDKGCLVLDGTELKGYYKFSYSGTKEGRLYYETPGVISQNFVKFDGDEQLRTINDLRIDVDKNTNIKVGQHSKDSRITYYENDDDSIVYGIYEYLNGDIAAEDKYKTTITGEELSINASGYLSDVYDAGGIHAEDLSIGTRDHPGNVTVKGYDVSNVKGMKKGVFLRGIDCDNKFELGRNSDVRVYDLTASSDNAADVCGIYACDAASVLKDAAVDVGNISADVCFGEIVPANIAGIEVSEGDLDNHGTVNIGTKGRKISMTFENDFDKENVAFQALATGIKCNTATEYGIDNHGKINIENIENNFATRSKGDIENDMKAVASGIYSYTDVNSYDGSSITINKENGMKLNVNAPNSDSGAYVTFGIEAERNLNLQGNAKVDIRAGQMDVTASNGDVEANSIAVKSSEIQAEDNSKVSGISNTSTVKGLDDGDNQLTMTCDTLDVKDNAYVYADGRKTKCPDKGEGIEAESIYIDGQGAIESFGSNNNAIECDSFFTQHEYIPMLEYGKNEFETKVIYPQSSSEYVKDSYEKISNKHEVLTPLAINKKWNDDNDKMKSRPSSVKFTVAGNGISKNVTVSAKNNWKCTLNVEKYDSDNNRIKYTVQENTVKDYKGTVTDSDGGYTWNAVNKYVGKKQAPGKVKIVKIKAGHKYAFVKWNKIKNADGYQFAFKKAKAKRWNSKVLKSSTVSKKINKLKKGKKYQFKVRAFVRNGSKKAYGKWSDIKSVKIK